VDNVLFFVSTIKLNVLVIYICFNSFFDHGYEYTLRFAGLIQLTNFPTLVMEIGVLRIKRLGEFVSRPFSICVIFLIMRREYRG